MHDRRMAPWIEWKERCAVALCSEETQAALLAFGGMRFRTLAQRCLPMINVRDIRDVMLPDNDAWHLLETHMTLPQSSNGKAYKQWLFARTAGSADAPFDIVQGGATLLMRSVVREHLRKEHSPSGHISAHHTPSPDEEVTTTGEEWLPGDVDTRDAVALRELTDIASCESSRRFDGLPSRVRLALAAKHLRVPLSSPVLLALAQCGKSVMSAAFRSFASALLEELATTYHGEDRATIGELAILVFDALTRRCVEWAIESEEHRAALLANAPALALEALS